MASTARAGKPPVDQATEGAAVVARALLSVIKAVQALAPSVSFLPSDPEGDLRTAVFQAEQRPGAGPAQQAAAGLNVLAQEIASVGGVAQLALMPTIQTVSAPLALPNAAGVAVAAASAAAGQSAPVLAAGQSAAAQTAQLQSAYMPPTNGGPTDANGPPGAMAQTVQNGMQAASQAAGSAQAAGAAQAANSMVSQVMPQAMASYAAGQVQGMTPTQAAAATGLNPADIKKDRLDQAANVAAGAAPTTPFPVVPVVVGGGLVVALATGVI